MVHHRRIRRHAGGLGFRPCPRVRRPRDRRSGRGCASSSRARARGPTAQRAGARPSLGGGAHDRPARHGCARRRRARDTPSWLRHLRAAPADRAVPGPDLVHPGHARPRPDAGIAHARVRTEGPRTARPPQTCASRWRRRSSASPGCAWAAASPWPWRRCASRRRSPPGSRVGPGRLAVRAPGLSLPAGDGLGDGDHRAGAAGCRRPGGCWASRTTRRVCGCA